MKKSSFLKIIFPMVLLFTSCQTGNISESHAEVLNLFQHPTSEYRSAPLWVWNDRISKKQIKEQLTDFKDKGIGGVFIHPRPGLITTYLSSEWLSLCHHAVDVGKSLDMKIWLYDENSYPSGFAGGHVPDQMPDAVRRGLRQTKLNLLPTSPDKSVYLILRRTESGWKAITDQRESWSGKSGEYIIYDFIEQNPSPWYGGFVYVDLMRREVTEKFLDITMNAYRSVIGEEFGQTVPGVFQDEAHIAPPGGRDTINYTPALFESFNKKWGYDLKLHLPSLFEETGDWRQVRHNYYATILDLFEDNWGKPYYEYCEASNLSFTGHYWEHEWPNPRRVADNMAMAAFSHMPGIDCLMNDWQTGPNAQFGNARAVKEIRSVANQLGRKRTMSETFGAGGWEMTFFDQKRIGDWEYALGVNFLNQHLSYVTLKGARKRDHPLSFSYHEPWWESYSLLADYFARLSVVMSLGRQKNSILVIEPTTTAWMVYSPAGPTAQLETIGKEFQTFVNQLESHQVEYDLGSEAILENHGRVKGKDLIVGECRYKLIILPPGLENLDRSSIDLLKEFLSAGGKILSLVYPPAYINGQQTDEMAELSAQFADSWVLTDKDTCWEKINTLSPAGLVFDNSQKSGGLLFHQHRILVDAEMVFLVNSSSSENSKGKFSTLGKGCEKWDPISGEVSPYPNLSSGKDITVSYSIPPGGSLLLCIRPVKSETTLSAESIKEVIEPAGETNIQALYPNILTLDYCDLLLGDNLKKELYFYDAQKMIFQHHGLERNPWDSAVQFKTNIVDRNRFAEDSGFAASFRFVVDGDAAALSLMVAAEMQATFILTVNGHEIRVSPDQWWLDKQFAVFKLSDSIHSGENVITLKCRPFSIFSELEPLYLLGDFSLRGGEKGFIISRSNKLDLGSWRRQGMPFYSSGVRYEREYLVRPKNGRFIVRLGEWLGTMAEVRVNGVQAGFIAFEPYELDISDFLNEGSNRISVIVNGSLKNTLGPHHNNPPLGRAWPAAFQRGATGGFPPGSKYHLLDYGLFEEFKLIRIQD